MQGNGRCCSGSGIGRDSVLDFSDRCMNGNCRTSRHVKYYIAIMMRVLRTLLMEPQVCSMLNLLPTKLDYDDVLFVSGACISVVTLWRNVKTLALKR